MSRIIGILAVFALLSACAVAADDKTIVIPEKSHTSTITIVAPGKTELPKVNKESMRRYQESAEAVNSAFHYAQAGKHTEALEWYQKALDIDPKLVIAYQDRAVEYLTLKNASKALADINSAIDLEPTNNDLYVIRCLALVQLKRYKDALSNADALVNAQPGESYFSLRADVKLKLGDKKGAIKDLQSAILASEQDGDDAMDSSDKLKFLTGKQVIRPLPDTAGSAMVIDTIAKIDNSNRKFEPGFIEEQTNLHLKEIPITNFPQEHSNRFHNTNDGTIFRTVSMSNQAARHGADVNISLDPHHVCITYDMVKQAFGPPATVDDDPPTTVIYNCSWGKLISPSTNMVLSRCLPSGCSTSKRNNALPTGASHNNQSKSNLSHLLFRKLEVGISVEMVSCALGLNSGLNVNPALVAELPVPLAILCEKIAEKAGEYHWHIDLIFLCHAQLSTTDGVNGFKWMSPSEAEHFGCPQELPSLMQRALTILGG